MKSRFSFRALFVEFASFLALVALMVAALSGITSCATSRDTATQTTITDTATLRQVQRLVAVSVPGDSAKLTTRIAYDEKTGRFRPVTIYSHAGRLGLAFTLDAFGVIRADAITSPFVAQVPVTDTEKTRTTHTTTKEKEVVAARKQYGAFVGFCVGFTVLVVLLGGCWLWGRFVSPLSFLKWL